MDVLRRGLYSHEFNNFDLLNGFERAVEECVQRPLDKATVKDFFGLDQ